MRAFRLASLLVFCVAVATVTPIDPARGEEPLPYDVPLPPVSWLLPPDPEVEGKVGGFSGAWAGEWRTFGSRSFVQVNHVLVVESVYPDHVIIAFAWGKSSMSEDMKRPGWVQAFGWTANGALATRLPNGATVTYTLENNGALRGVWVQDDIIAHAILRRAKISARP